MGVQQMYELKREFELRFQRQKFIQNSQYELSRALQACADAKEALGLVLRSLKSCLQLDFALGLLKLDAEMTPLEMIVLGNSAASNMTSQSELLQNDRQLVEHSDERLASEWEQGSQGRLAVFVHQRFCGLLRLERTNSNAFAPEECEIFTLWRAMFQDALERLETQKRAQHRLELMANTLPWGVILADEKGRIQLVNAAAKNTFCLNIREDTRFETLISALGLNLEACRNLSGGRSSVHEIQHDDRLWTLQLSHLGDEGQMALIRERTDAELDSERDEWVHVLGHELRNPLNCLGSILDLFENQVLGELNPRQREYVGMAQDTCSRLNRITEELLDCARLQNGHFQLELSNFDLVPFLRETVKRFEASALEKGIHLSFESHVSQANCRGDVFRLGQVLGNLLSNAMKFTPSGGQIRLEIWSSPFIPDLFVISLFDDGEEISPQDLPKVFEKYKQFRSGMRKGGLGLGLSIASKIVEAHGGVMWAESGRGEGATFLFALPRQSAEAVMRSSQAGEALLICDEKSTRWALKASLLLLHFQVDCLPFEALKTNIPNERVLICADVAGRFALDYAGWRASHREQPALFFSRSNYGKMEYIDFITDFPCSTSGLCRVLEAAVTHHQRS